MTEAEVLLLKIKEAFDEYIQASLSGSLERLKKASEDIALIEQDTESYFTREGADVPGNNHNWK